MLMLKQSKKSFFLKALALLGMLLVTPIFLYTQLPNLELYQPFNPNHFIKQNPSSKSDVPIDKENLIKSYNKLPLTFEINKGQFDQQVKFFSPGKSYDLFLTGKEAVFALRAKSKKATNSIKMRFSNMNPSSAIQGIDELEAKSNYFIGNDPSKWRKDVSHYTKVEYQAVYPNIDLVYYGSPNQLEYDLLVHPGANPKDIKLNFEGVDTIKVEDSGDLLLKVGEIELRKHKPIVYQKALDGSQKIIDGNYLVSNQQEISFELGFYDTSSLLIIDPVFSYSTYLGGDSSDFINDVAIDNNGNVYIVGETLSMNFPTTPGSLQPTGETSAFITKLNPSGNALIYSTYIGGKNNNPDISSRIISIAVDKIGNAYITGIAPVGLPVTPGAFQKTPSGRGDAFITAISSTGNTLLYSTYLGGDEFDSARGVAVDLLGNTYVVGTTFSKNFPTLNAFQTNNAGGEGGTILQGDDAFIAKFNSLGNPIFSSYLGGSASEEGTAVSVDSDGSIYVIGSTASANFPTVNPLQSELWGGVNTFVAKINSSGSALIYSTYLGTLIDLGRDIVVDGMGNAYITVLASDGFPTTPGTFQPKSEMRNPVVAKISPTGDKLIYSTYVGSPNANLANTNIPNSIAVDSTGNAYVVGFTFANDFPTVDALQASLRGEVDGFVAKLNPTGSALIYSTYLGGNERDTISSIAVDSSGNAYVVGTTNSDNFPVLNAFQTMRQGSPAGLPFDGFVAKISDSTAIGDFALKVSPSRQVVSPGSSTSYTISAQGFAGFSQPINLTASVSPNDGNINLILSSNTLTTNSSVTLTANTSTVVPLGSFSVTIKGVFGNLIKTETVTLETQNTPDFSISFNPSTIMIARGKTTFATLNINRINGFSGNVAITPPNTSQIKVKITPPSQSTSGTNVNFNFKAKKATPIGNQQLTFSGRDDSGRVRTATLSLVVQ